MIHVNLMTQQLRNDLATRRWRERNPEKSREGNRRSSHKRLPQRREAARVRHQHNPDVNAQKCKAWARRSPEAKRKSACDTLYGKGAYEHFQQQIDIQQGCCAICGENFPSSFGTHRDHDHNTKQWRGALCTGCNAGLGNFKENPRLFLKAIDYLKSWRMR